VQHQADEGSQRRQGDPEVNTVTVLPVSHHSGEPNKNPSTERTPASSAVLATTSPAVATPDLTPGRTSNAPAARGKKSGAIS